MNAMLNVFKRYATLQFAFVALVALQLTVAILQRVDQPLRALAPDESKLDFQSQYDSSTIQRIFDAYGQQGRTIYAWDLVVDTFYPVLLSLAAILFILLVVDNSKWQKLLILFPLIFAITDVVENAFFLSFLQMYPEFSPILVSMANFFTRIKLFAISIIYLELYLFVILTILIFLLNKLRGVQAKKAVV